ncbi:MAG: hypothetical protein AAFU85_28510, partial [Planctomycetota bacterium]
MNLVGMVMNAFRSATPRMATSHAGYHPSDPKLLEFLGLKQQTRAGVSMDHYEMMALPGVYRGIEIISNKMAAIPFYVFEQNEDETKTFDRSHPS